MCRGSRGTAEALSKMTSILSPSLWRLRWDEHHHPLPPALSSITMSHNIGSNQSNYQSAITLTWLRPLLFLMTDKRWPSQSAVDNLPLIFTASIFYVSRLHPAAGMSCFFPLLSLSLAASILFQIKCVASLHVAPPSLSSSHNSFSGFCFICDLCVYQQSENTQISV